MSSDNRYILTLSCKDVPGIVAGVSGFLFENGGFIKESAQFGDPSTEKFFMRTDFTAKISEKELNKKFKAIADKFGMEYKFTEFNYKPKLLIMVSKKAHCLNDLLHHVFTGNLQAEIPGIISNHKDLKYLADFYKIPFFHLSVTKENKKGQEEKLYELFKKSGADLLVLARYMQILSPELTDKMKGKAINIHHSFLPGFKGAKPYLQAYNRGVKIIGATAHFVTKELDEGPIIEQEIIHTDHNSDAKELEQSGEDIERRVLTRAVKYYIENRILMNDNKTVVFK